MKDTKTIIVWSGIIFLLFVFMATAIAVAVYNGETWAIVLCTIFVTTLLILVGVVISNLAIWSNWMQDKQLMSAQARLMNEDVLANARAMSEVQKTMLLAQRTGTENARLQNITRPEESFFEVAHGLYSGLED